MPRYAALAVLIRSLISVITILMLPSAFAQDSGTFNAMKSIAVTKFNPPGFGKTISITNLSPHVQNNLIVFKQSDVFFGKPFVVEPGHLRVRSDNILAGSHFPDWEISAPLTRVKRTVYEPTNFGSGQIAGIYNNNFGDLFFLIKKFHSPWFDSEVSTLEDSSIVSLALADCGSNLPQQDSRSGEDGGENSRPALSREAKEISILLGAFFVGIGIAWMLTKKEYWREPKRAAKKHQYK